MRGITDYHRSCADNLHEALRELGLSTPETPAPFNLWMNVPWDSHGKLENKVPASKPGDYITLRADMDAIIVFSCCPNVRPSLCYLLAALIWRRRLMCFLAACRTSCR